MPSDAGTPSLTGRWVESTEIISKAMIRGVSYASLEGVRAVAYPVSRTVPGQSGTGRP